MPEKIVKQVTKDDGTVEYVDVTPDDLPVELVRSHKSHKDVVEESRKRLSRAQNAERMINEIKVKTGNSDLTEVDDTEEDDEDTAETERTPRKPAKQPQKGKAEPIVEDEETVYARMRERLVKELGIETPEERNAKAEKAKAVTTLMEKHGLSSEDDRFLISTSTDPEGTATRLAKASYRFDDYSAGDTRNVIESDPVKKALSSFMSKYSTGKK